MITTMMAFLAFSFWQCGGESKKAIPAAKGLGKGGALQVSEGDRCPVCAMRIAEHPKTAAAIELMDKTTFYFCGTGCLIKSWLHPEVYLGVEASRLSRAVVPDYFTGAPLDAMKAKWVAGSDVVGPMGPALVPLRTEAELEKFKERHGGKTVFTLDGMTDARFKSITGKPLLPAK
jgi:nitrous oxide reductase accessory protein NosL